MKQRQIPKNYENNYKKVPLKDIDESEEETELFTYKSRFKEIPTVEKIVEDGDTLQAISIRYHCSISELKRLNNIHKENEIYAKRTIKVPAHAFTMALVHISGNSSPSEKSCAIKKEVDVLLEQKLSNKLLELTESPSNQTDFNALIFNSNIASKACDNTSEELIEDEEISLLPNEPVIREPEFTRISCSGADADISWIALIVCVIVIVFAVPVIYVFYIAEHPDQYLHHGHNS